MKQENVAMSSVPLNYGDANYDPLLSCDFDLTY
jgi:hypothetical protein